MTWRGQATASDRFFACLVYLLPLAEGILFGQFIFERFPPLAILQALALPVLTLYTLIPFGSMVIFFALFFLVVRNESICHFIRFNTLQALLIGIALSLSRLVFFDLLRLHQTSFLIAETLFNVLFLGTVAAVGYAIFQSALGRYAEIPTISDAAYIQLR